MSSARFGERPPSNQPSPARQPATASTVSGQVTDLQNMMRDNIQKAMKRGEQLENLEQRTDYLNTNATDFKQTTIKAKNKFYYKNMKWALIGIGLLIIFILIIVLIIYFKFKK